MATMRNDRRTVRWGVLCGLAMLVGGTSGATAAPYYLQASQTGDWNTLSTWFDQTSGGGANPSTLNGNDLYSNGFRVRRNGADTFGNAATTLNINSTLLVRGSTGTVATLRTYGTSAQIAAGQSPVTFTATNLQNDAVTTSLTGDGTSNRIQTLNIGTLTGDGDFALTQTSTVHFMATNALAFTGDIRWGDTSNAVLNFGGDLVSGGNLIVPATGRIALDQAVTFQAVTITGTPLGAGTYTFDDLNTAYPTVFVDGGSGSITVVPEPGAAMLAIAGFAAASLGRRRA